MTVRLTYTSGALSSELDDAFDAHLSSARERAEGPLTHLVAGGPLDEGEVLERENPAHVDEVASRLYTGTEEIVGRAVEAARVACEEWRHTPYHERNSRLRRAAQAISDRHIEIASVLSLETGKTRVEAIAEVQEGIDLIEQYCGEIERNEGFVQRLASFVDREQNTDVLRPYGVFGVISPFNFPFALTIGMTSAALVAGNAVVLKPSEEAPWSAALVGEILAAADLPAGAFNLVHGGPQVGRLLVDSDVDGIAFTGSAEVGREIARSMQEGRYARPALTEMGGKNPTIVTTRADLDKAAEGVARAAFGLSGQKCSACSRAIVLEPVLDEFGERLAAFADSLQLGDPADHDAFLGPVINASGVRRFEEAVASVRAAGGSVLAGGGRPDDHGYFVEPTVVTRLPRGHDLTRRELFMPFVTVESAASLDDAIAEANAPIYGLTAGIFTDDDAETEQFLDTIEAGVVYVNRQAGSTTGAWPGTQTFCGWKSSGSTGKGGLGSYYVPQFMREQSRTIVG
jgi:1-pyrroline-5-carboxylate dehydrogenase